VQAVQTLFANLEQHAPPLVLLSQYLPEQYRAVREGSLANTATGAAPHRPVPGRVRPRLQRQPGRTRTRHAGSAAAAANG
jgi:D-tagatose-1,6-bisphosphate aldolase subunit GatZ/KbaZ